MKINKILYPILLVTIGSGIFFLPNLIKIKKIECTSQYGPCSNFVRENLEKREGLSLRQSRKEISAFLSGEAGIGDFSLRLKFPSTLSASVLEKKARYAIKDNERKVFLTVDEAGSVVAIFPETNLPYVEIEKTDLNTKDKIPTTYAVALSIIERLHAAYQLKSGRLQGDYLLAALPAGYTVYFPLDRDPQELMGALSLILSAKIKLDPGLKTIDLRFKNPVLR